MWGQLCLISSNVILDSEYYVVFYTKLHQHLVYFSKNCIYAKLKLTERSYRARERVPQMPTAEVMNARLA